MQNFSQWLDDFTIEQQINLNDRFTFNRENGAKVDEIKDIMRESDEVAQDFQKFNFDKREEPDFKETKEQANRQARRQ